MASKVPVGRRDSGGQHVQMGRTVALVDLRHHPRTTPGARTNGSATAFDLALQRIEQAVRSNDRVCPFGISRVAIAFGPDADAVAPKVLGQRLARAVRLSTASEDEAEGQLQGGVSEMDDTSLRPLAFGPSAATVTVDRMADRAPSSNGTEDDSTVASRTSDTPRPNLWLRTVVRCAAGGFAKYGTRRGDELVPGDRGTILVVSPSRTSGGAPGLSAMAASAIVERLGFDGSAVSLSCEDELVLDVRGAAVDLVVLVVEGERESASDLATWTSSTWHIPSQLAARYYSRGIGVLAVGAGGGAGALAGCVAQGATVVLDLDEMQAELSHLRDVPGADESWVPPGGGGRIPPPMEALLLLTASERRVLFYLTTGQSAQHIADDLVVSVTTVRSHIRSILRKLGVRSQLAAVAIANSQDFGRHHPGGTASEAQREFETPGVA